MLGDISRLRSSGDRHAIRNFLQGKYGEEKARVTSQIAQQIFLAGNAARGDETGLHFLQEICIPFGIESFDDRNCLEDSLNKVIINSEEAEEDMIEESFGDLFDDFIAEEVYLDEAYLQFKRTDNNLPAGHPLKDFDPFALFYSLLTIEEVIAEVNKRFKSVGEMTFLDNLPLSQAISQAADQAKKEKGVTLPIQQELKFDPIFITNKDAFIYTIRDIIYNAIDAGASRLKITALRPSEEEKLPYADEFSFGFYPNAYMMFEDNGSGIPPDKAREINHYLKSGSGDERTLSTKIKGEGGLGSKNFRDFLQLHSGHCHYESIEQGTRIHAYFEKLEIDRTALSPQSIRKERERCHQCEQRKDSSGTQSG